MVRPSIITNGGVDVTTDDANSGPQFSDFHDPFYASIFPQCYALAATTIISYMLVIMLVIAPRSFLDGGVVVLGQRGFTNGPNNISIGGRPWLQKVAALTVAISLTIATADTFRVAEIQYSWGVQNAQDLQETVLEGTELKVIRIISDVFLWLAQAQTLIRLFPRQREKIIIKWTAFLLITLNVIFSSLNSFQYAGGGNAKPRSFTDAVPALSYLFQLSLGLLYAAWVIYYSLLKKRYAFYHPLMKNICLVATLSIISILVPVVFFILDISKPDFTGWGDYVRWVGAAAASVVVWEWVERIEALEREEKKDGILGREVFDGDEMMDMSESRFPWPRRRKQPKKSLDDQGEGGDTIHHTDPSFGGTENRAWPAMSAIANRYRPKRRNSDVDPNNADNAVPTTGRSGNRLRPLWPARPAPAATPISRADTSSAASTVYAIRYQPVSETMSQITSERQPRTMSRQGSTASTSSGSSSRSPHRVPAEDQPQNSSGATSGAKNAKGNSRNWRAFVPRLPATSSDSRKPPAELSAHTRKPETPDEDELSKWDIRGRLEQFAASKAERIWEKMRATPDTDTLPVTVIPAPPRRGDALAQVLAGEEQTGSLSTQSQTYNMLPSTTASVSREESSMLGRSVTSRQTTSDGPSSRSPRSVAQRNDTLQLRTSTRGPVVPRSPARTGSQPENTNNSDSATEQ